MSLAFAVPGLRFGPMRLTAYGLCAATGVLAAVTLSGRVARRLGLSSEAAWDAGLFAVICCFAASRLLLILADPIAFRHYPLLVLGLPSLTLGGMALAGIAVWIYLRHKRQPILTLLDAFAPGSALLAAFLELGHWADGSEAGMPLGRAGDPAASLMLWPVSMLGVALSLLLAILLLWLLRRDPARGTVAALAMGLGGLFAFTLDLVSLPSDLFAGLPLEPGQMVALTAILTGVLVWTLAPRHSPVRPVPAPEIR